MGDLAWHVAFLVSVPGVIFEDDHLLAVNKPAGMNTHAPSPWAGEGIYDWLRHREPRWARLAIVHRLDKETSGVLVFSKSEPANRSLTGQFTGRTVRKRYLLLTDRTVRRKEFTVKSALVRVGEEYVPRPVHAGGEPAETRFRAVRSSAGVTWLEAEPVTGRTHQIRAHAAAGGFPILGDTRYGGTPAARLHLHAQDLILKHPVTGRETAFSAPADFGADTRLVLRSALIDLRATNACRLIHGASDGWPGWYVDRLGHFLLSQSDRDLSDAQQGRLAELMEHHSLRGGYHKVIRRQAANTGPAQAWPHKVLGADAPEEFVIRENGVQFALRFNEGCSVGLFLDQRDNRRRLLTGHIAAGFSFRPGVEAVPSPAAPQQGSERSLPMSAEPAGQASRLPLRPLAIDTTNAGEMPAPLLRRPGAVPLAGLELLNAFSYTCGFSVCAAKAGARTTSLDLSRKYLEWGRRNFALNGLNDAEHDFVYGDVFDWLRRFAKRGRMFDVIVLDPPTFSQSKEHGTFQAEKHYGKLVTSALPLLKPEGVLFAATNAAKLSPEPFLRQVTAAVGSTGRKILHRHYTPQPPDFPVSRAEPAYLKTVWLQLA